MQVIILLVIVIILLLKRDTVFVRKLWKYVVISFSLIFYFIQRSFFKLRNNKSNRMSANMSQKEIDLENKIRDLGDRYKEVDMEAKIEIKALNTNNERLKEQLEEAKKIKNKDERRERLYSLINNNTI